MIKSVAIIQSNYIPWKGYFNIINAVDEFVLLEDVQYTRRDWRNRNLIKTKIGPKWLTIPVNVKGQFSVAIKDVHTINNEWRADHWNQIKEAYKKSRYFDIYSAGFENLYLKNTESNLCEINYSFIRHINTLLNIKTPIRRSMEFNAPLEKTERLVHICRSLNADTYISGMAAKSYLNTELFRSKGIEVQWADYTNYQPYQQLHLPFENGVSIIDLIFNTGPDAIQYFKTKIYNK